MNTIEEDIEKAKELLDEYKNIIQYQSSGLDAWKCKAKGILSNLNKSIRQARKSRMNLELLGTAEQLESKLKALLNVMQPPQPKTPPAVRKKMRKPKMDIALRDKIVDRIIELEDREPTIEMVERMRNWLESMLYNTTDPLRRAAIEEGLFYCGILLRNVERRIYRAMLREKYNDYIREEALRELYEYSFGTDAVKYASWQIHNEVRSVDRFRVTFYGNGDIRIIL